MDQKESFHELFQRRAEYSNSRLIELRKKLGGINEFNNFPKLTIFSAGSYARLEASVMSRLIC